FSGSGDSLFWGAAGVTALDARGEPGQSLVERAILDPGDDGVRTALGVVVAERAAGRAGLFRQIAVPDQRVAILEGDVHRAQSPVIVGRLRSKILIWIAPRLPGTFGN